MPIPDTATADAVEAAGAVEGVGVAVGAAVAAVAGAAGRAVGRAPPACKSPDGASGPALLPVSCMPSLVTMRTTPQCADSALI